MPLLATPHYQSPSELKILVKLQKLNFKTFIEVELAIFLHHIVHDVLSTPRQLQSDLAQSKAMICCCCIVDGALWPGVCAHGRVCVSEPHLKTGNSEATCVI